MLGYDSAKTYYFVLGTRFEYLSSFTAAVSPRETYGYYEVAELVAPGDEKSDSSLTAPVTSVWVATSMDVPHGSWGFVRPVGITDQYLRFYIPGSKSGRRLDQVEVLLLLLST